MSYTPPQSLSVDLTPIIDLLNQNNECCVLNYRLITDINNRLIKYEFFMNAFMNCFKPCDTGVIIDNPIRPVRPVIPGKSVQPPRQAPITPITIGTQKPVKREISYVPSVPIISVNREEYDTPFYPHASVIGIAGKYKIVNDTYVGPDGLDLSKYLPLELNYKNGDIILEAIRDYRVLTLNDEYRTKSVVLVYQTYDTRTGVRKTFEGSVSNYRKWWDIHSGNLEANKKVVSGRSYQKGVID